MDGIKAQPLLKIRYFLLILISCFVTVNQQYLLQFLLNMLPLRKELFWDTDFNNLYVEKHKRIIIERVLTLGNLDEFLFILNTYDNQTLISVIQQLGYIDPKTLSFVESFFNLSKKELTCYIKKQSATTHWN